MQTRLAKRAALVIPATQQEDVTTSLKSVRTAKDRKGLKRMVRKKTQDVGVWLAEWAGSNSCLWVLMGEFPAGGAQVSETSRVK